MTLGDQPTTEPTAIATAEPDRVGQTTVVICTKGRDTVVAQAAGSVLIDPDEDVVLIVVDQNEDDRVVRALAPYANDTRLNHVRVDLGGAGRARNTALALANTPVVCFTDDDCVVPRGWAKKMTKLLLDRPEVSIVFGSVTALPTADLRPGYTPTFPVEEEVEFSTWGLDARVERLGIGASMALRLADARDVGGFDPMMGPGSAFPSADDRELAIRFLLTDRRVLMTPVGVLEHDGFRLDGEAARAHSQRDHYALGGMLAKLVDADRFWALAHFGLFTGHLLGDILKASVRARRVQGAGKLKWLALGFRDGRRHPRVAGQPIFVDTVASATRASTSTTTI